MREFILAVALILIPSIVVGAGRRRVINAETAPPLPTPPISDDTDDAPVDIQSIRYNNTVAFLEMIQWTEGTDRRSDPYAVTFNYDHTIRDFSDHPTNTGEWSGYPLSDAVCAGAGFGPGCKSTAAGAYQILKPTWDRIRRKLSLSDFSSANQDQAALELIRERGALNDLYNGDIISAVYKTSWEWASLPAPDGESRYGGQPNKSIDNIINFYLSRGGTLDFVTV